MLHLAADRCFLVPGFKSNPILYLLHTCAVLAAITAPVTLGPSVHCSHSKLWPCPSHISWIRYRESLFFPICFCWQRKQTIIVPSGFMRKRGCSFLTTRLILPSSSVRELISTDGCPFVNMKHGSDQMLNTDRPDNEQAGLVGHWARHIIFTLFEPVLAHCKCLKDIRYVWWGCCFKRAFGLMVQWEDERTGSAVGEFFMTVHMCLSFIKPAVWLRKWTHLVAQLCSF